MDWVNWQHKYAWKDWRNRGTYLGAPVGSAGASGRARPERRGGPYSPAAGTFKARHISSLLALELAAAEHSRRATKCRRRRHRHRFSARRIDRVTLYCWKVYGLLEGSFSSLACPPILYRLCIYKDPTAKPIRFRSAFWRGDILYS